jgi:hypothetical protein
MIETINLFYIVSTLNKDQIMSHKFLFNTDTLKDLPHLNQDYYVGFSGFENLEQILPTPVNYDFYYFYNMLEDKRTIYDIIKFGEEMAYIDLISFEIHRLKKLKEREMLCDKILQEELSKYRKYLDEMSNWLSNDVCTPLKLRFYNNEDISLCYLIERVDLNNNLLSSSTI